VKILHLTTHLNRGGISKYIQSVGEALHAKGHEILVASSGGEMEDEFRDGGIKLKTFPIRTKSELSPKIYQALPAMIRWVREEQIDLIHAHTRITQVMAAWIQWITKIPFITTCHGFYKRRLGRRVLPAWGNHVVAISEPVASHLRDTFHVPAEKIRVVYNGVDLRGLVSRFFNCKPREVRREYKIPEDAYVVGTTARLVPDKGHEYLIRAVKHLESRAPDLNLLIVGDGRYRKHLESLTKELRLTRRVRFAGNLKDVSRPLAAMDVFVLSAIWREGFGLSIVEAMACQKPVIVTNIWALNTLIQNKVNGILVEPRNVEDLAGAIWLLHENRSFREGIGQAGRVTAEQRFSLDRMVDELEDVYEEALKG
jgi:glycosyltransferase involved in cell wall biosynthesis